MRRNQVDYIYQISDKSELTVKKGDIYMGVW